MGTLRRPPVVPRTMTHTNAPGPGASDSPTPDPPARDARVEATAVLGGSAVRLLEPSPPADADDAQYLADDPPNRSVPGESGPPVSAVVGPGRRPWEEVVQERTDLESWALDRWLGPWRRLSGAVPNQYHETRVALHRVALYVLSDVRMQAIGKMALRHTFRGFGTPFFGPDDRQVRVEGLDLIDQRGSGAAATPLTTLAAAAAHVDVEIDRTKPESFDVPGPGDLDAPLAIEVDGAAFLADWFGFGWSVLEQVRIDTDSGLEPSRPQLWPEHFDPAFEAGDEASGRRAGFGASPGDHHEGGDPEPYLYLSLWSRDDVPDHEFWNTPFGAKLAYADLAAADDQRATALDFFSRGRSLLQG